MTASLKHYITGFTLSLAVTLMAYFSVVNHWLNGSALIVLIFALALAQFIIQLLYFLHLGPHSRDNTLFFVATIGIIFIIIGGSFWIIEKLNFNMTPGQIQDYMKDQGSY